MDEYVAWIEFLKKIHNAKAVNVNGVFKVVPMTCENCFHRYNFKTKLCSTASSVGCDDWEYKEAK